MPVYNIVQCNGIAACGAVPLLAAIGHDSAATAYRWTLVARTKADSADVSYSTWPADTVTGETFCTAEVVNLGPIEVSAMPPSEPAISQPA